MLDVASDEADLSGEVASVGIMMTVAFPLAGLALVAGVAPVVVWLYRRDRPNLTGYRVRAAAAGDRCPSCRAGVLREANGRSS